MADITITEGDTLEVDYSLENTGDGSGTFDPRLLVQGTQEDQDTGITLDPSQTATGTLQWPTESGDAVTDALAEAVTDDTSDSITVTVESAIPDSVVDNFEPANGDPAGVYESGEGLSDYYSGSFSDFSRDTNSPVIEGSYSLKQSGTFTAIVSNSGLQQYPAPGDTISCYVYGDTSLGSDGPNTQYLWFAEDGNNHYVSQVNPDASSGEELRLYRFSGGSVVESTFGSASVSQDTQYDAETSIGSGGSVTLTVYTIDGSGNRTGEAASVSHTFDDTVSSWGATGIGFRGRESVYDSYRIL